MYGAWFVLPIFYLSLWLIDKNEYKNSNKTK